MPDLTTVAVVTSGILLAVFLIVWLVLINRKYVHTGPTVNPNWLLTKKNWIGGDPFEFDANSGRQTSSQANRSSREQDEAKTNLEERVKHRSRVFMHHIYAYCRSLRTERSAETLFSLMGRREDKIFCLVDDPFINQTFLSFADTSSRVPKVKTLMYAVRVSHKPISKSKFSATSAPMQQRGSRGAERHSFGTSGIPTTEELTAADYALANMFAIETSPRNSNDELFDPVNESATSYSQATPRLTDETGLKVYHPPIAYATARYDNLLRSTLLTLTQSHPFLLPVFDCGFSFDKRTAFVCRPLIASGSLRDVIWSVSDPTAPITVKYPTLDRNGINGRDNVAISPKPLSTRQIARYGRQILEALAFMDQIGIPFVNLHLGNVIYIKDQDKVMLTEIESGFLGIYPRHIKRLQRAGPHDPVVVAFAILLFEMATGKQLPIPRFPSFPRLDALSGEYDDVADIIKFIFLPRAPQLGTDGRNRLKKIQAKASAKGSRVNIDELVSEILTSGLPPYVTCRDLLKFPFFADVQLETEDVARLPSLAETSRSLANRLKEDVALEKLLGEDDRHAIQFSKSRSMRAQSFAKQQDTVQEHKGSQDDKLAQAVELFLPPALSTRERPQSASAPYDTINLQIDRRVKVMMWNSMLPICSSLPLASYTLKDRLGVVKGKRHSRQQAADAKAELDILKSSGDHEKWGSETESRKAKTEKKRASSGGFLSFFYSYDDDAEDEEEEEDDTNVRGDTIFAEEEKSDGIISPYAAALSKYSGKRQREPKQQRLEGVGTVTKEDEHKSTLKSQMNGDGERSTRPTKQGSSKTNLRPPTSNGDNENKDDIVIDFGTNEDEDSIF